MFPVETEIIITVGIGFLSVILYYVFSIYKNTFPYKQTQKEIVQITSTLFMFGFIVLSYFTDSQNNLDNVVIKYKMVLLSCLSIVCGLEIYKAVKMFYDYRNKSK